MHVDVRTCKSIFWIFYNKKLFFWKIDDDSGQQPAVVVLFFGPSIFTIQWMLSISPTTSHCKITQYRVVCAAIVHCVHSHKFTNLYARRFWYLPSLSLAFDTSTYFTNGLCVSVAYTLYTAYNHRQPLTAYFVMADTEHLNISYESFTYVCWL